MVTIVADLAGGGLSGVALPALAHARFGAAGYGALLACPAADGRHRHAGDRDGRGRRTARPQPVVKA